MDIQFHWIGEATTILRIGDLTIAMDPALCPKGTVQDYFWFKATRIEEPIFEDKDFDNIDLWLITHNHEDHLDELGLAKISNETCVITNRNSSKQLIKKGIKDLTILNRGSVKELSIKGYQIRIEAIPAIHGISPVSALLSGIGNGYYVTISKDGEQKSIYYTGDTVYKSRVLKAMQGKQIDLMIPNMGAAKQGNWVMTLTLNSKMLKKMIAKLNPKKVIPVHYGTFAHLVEPVEKIEALKDPYIEIIKVGEKRVVSI